MPDRARKHVLVVEDDPEVAGVIAGLLGDAEFRVTVAGDGASMRDVLRNDDSIDVVILDAQLPGEQGGPLAEFARTLRLPVVMCSGSLEAIEFAEQHGLQMLRKPFHRDDLLDALGEAMRSGVAGQRER